MPLEIIKAEYIHRRDFIDCTQKVKEKVIDGESIDIVANNDLCGDPSPGKRKKLKIKYVHNGTEKEIIIKEGKIFRILKKENQNTIKNIKQVLPESERIEPPSKVEKPNFTDIIIPTYNNERLTVACFESIKSNTEPGTYRIIWVDNGSKDFKQAKEAIKDINHIPIMLKKNTGFVGAINTGLAKSNAPIVCFLNNDTEVSYRWLDKLTDILYSDPKIGIIGPLTGPPAIKQQYDSHHNIAYQQLHRQQPVFPYYRNLFDFNQRIEAMQSRLIGDISFVAFLCAVLKREVIEKVTGFHPSYKNGLDENYAMGMWDDCDYNWAIEKIGYKKAIALDTCIIHKGRSTFKVIQEKENFNVDKLLNKNKKYMDKKMATIENNLKKD